MGETTVGHVAGEVVRALYGAGYMESTIGQYRKSIRALERYAGGPDAVYTRGLGAGFAASTFSERTGGFSRQRCVLLQCLFDRFGSVFPQCGLMVFPGVVIVSR